MLGVVGKPAMTLAALRLFLFRSQNESDLVTAKQSENVRAMSDVDVAAIAYVEGPKMI